ALEPGTGCYAAMLNPKGRVVADMRILQTGEEKFLLDTEAEAHEAVLRDLRMYKIGRQVQIADTTAERFVMSLVGPRAGEIAEAALGAQPGAVEHASLDTGGVMVVRTDLGMDVIGGSERATD